MKRLLSLFLLAALLLTGCSRKLTVDKENKTMSDGKYTYTYTDKTTTNGGNTIHTVTITYPNGAVYSWRQSGGAISTTTYDTSGSYDPVEYAPGGDLIEALYPEDEESDNTIGDAEVWLLIGGLFFLGMGIWQVCAPYFFWRLRFGRYVKDAEPSDRGLEVVIASGVLAIICAIILVIVAIF